MLPPQQVICANCGFQNGPGFATATSAGDDPALRALIPVGQSPYAIIAGYLGLFSVMCLPAPFAIIFGFLALSDIKKNPKRHGKGRAIFGIVMGIGVLVGFPLLMFIISATT